MGNYELFLKEIGQIQYLLENSEESQKLMYPYDEDPQWQYYHD